MIGSYYAPTINVQYLDFKNSIPATATCNEDGSYTIFINSRLTKERQTDSYIHELGHILRLDFEHNHDKNADVLEYYTHCINN